MVEVREISKELQEKAIKELNEDVARIPEDIKNIKDWLKHLKYINARTDDQILLTFLRGCKFSLERTKEKLEIFYTMKTVLPEFYSNRDPFAPEIQELLKLGVVVPLAKSKDVTRPRVILARHGLYDPSKIHIENLFKTTSMIMDIVLNEDDQAIICGMNLVVNMKGTTMSHIISPMIAKKLSKIIQDGYPARIKGIHALHIPSFFEILYAVIKPFLNKKMLKRVQVHNTNAADNLDEFYNVVPQVMMPKDYGGEGPTLQELTDEWKAKVESYQEWFKEDEKYGTVEELRPGKPKSSQDYFGGLEDVEGSFRKLNVD